VVVEIDNKNGDFGGFVTWPFRQFGNSGVDQEYPDLIITQGKALDHQNSSEGHQNSVQLRVDFTTL
jgi:hypothetical protein